MEEVNLKKITHWVIPSIRNSGKGNTTEIVKKISGCQGLGRVRKGIEKEQIGRTEEF